MRYSYSKISKIHIVFLILSFIFSSTVVPAEEEISTEEALVVEERVGDKAETPGETEAGEEKFSDEEWTEVISIEEVASGGDKLEQTIALDYKGADLATVLRSMAWTYDLNIVTSPDIKGRVTISLKDVTVRDALEAILTINGLAYSERAGIIYIAPGDPKTVEMQTEVLFLKYISASEAQNILRKIISPKGDMKISELSNSLILTDFPGNVKKALSLLEKVDVPPLQVLIEAKIVDITSTDLAAIGVTWDTDYHPGTALFKRQARGVAERLKETVTIPEKSSELEGGQITIDTCDLFDISITASIDALVKEGRAHLLASPSIAVLNGREARIIIGERYPYKERTQTPSGTTETTKFVDIGVTLRVTPQINDDGYITMRVHPEVSSLYASLGAGPRITTREADTTVRIKEGETLVIGGLIKQSDDRTKEKIPILGHIPLIGFLFSRSEKKAEQKELAVFITPKILRSREEKQLLSKEESEKEEVCVNLEKTAELNLVEKIFEKARSLDKSYGVESTRKKKPFRKAQALNLYEHIVLEFPDSMRAPEAIYRAGLIYFRYLKNYPKAKAAFSDLTAVYPDSPFAKKAWRESKRIEQREKSLAEKQAEKEKGEERREKEEERKKIQEEKEAGKAQLAKEKSLAEKQAEIESTEQVISWLIEERKEKGLAEKQAEIELVEQKKEEEKKILDPGKKKPKEVWEEIYREARKKELWETKKRETFIKRIERKRKERAKERALQKKKANIYFQKGLEYYQAGNLSLAVRIWEKALEMNVKDKKIEKYLKKARQELKK